MVPSEEAVSEVNEPTTRVEMMRRLIEAAESDPRVVGLADYGSSSQGRADEWSDVDVAVFVRDADFAAFEADWKRWAAGLGDLLLAYVSGVGHPWTVYDAAPVPLRVDFALYRESEVDALLNCPNGPTTVEAMVRYDATGGALTERARRLVGKASRPADLAATFALTSGEFWYYLVRTYCKLQREGQWGARHDFNWIVTYHLIALLRLEAGAVDEWQGRSAPVGIERALSPTRLAQLDACIPTASADGLASALRHAAELGREACASLARQHGWEWPEALAERMLSLLRERGPRAE